MVSTAGPPAYRFMRAPAPKQTAIGAWRPVWRDGYISQRSSPYGSLQFFDQPVLKGTIVAGQERTMRDLRSISSSKLMSLV
jgi:hypothetical protein